MRKKEYLINEQFLIDLGNHIRKVRKQKGYTQEKLANEIYVDISQISRIERGILNTSISTIKAISEALGVPLKELLDF
ncbi:helix-turn-helix transcriptional regulator [Tamlana sp. s12]|uniref:helix-turn-helix domain-containing protein n=1 Tax=Tamlana sp. s12 TaxID=1630406 RepID=UPI00192C1164|nr:helix-turn-helix transcriptional regulator [Tamlana sp. s12]QQY81854.1 helix-turn-helix transcriptional regulator [Tamlana sp. s12]